MNLCWVGLHNFEFSPTLCRDCGVEISFYDPFTLWAMALLLVYLRLFWLVGVEPVMGIIKCGGK